MGETRKNPLYLGADLSPVFATLVSPRTTKVIRPFVHSIEGICGIEDEVAPTSEQLFQRAWEDPSNMSPSRRLVLYSLQALQSKRTSANPEPLTSMQDRDTRMHEIVLQQFIMHTIRESFEKVPDPAIHTVPPELLEYVVATATEYFYKDFTDIYDVYTVSSPNFEVVTRWLDRYVRTEIQQLTSKAADSEMVPLWQGVKQNEQKGFGLMRFYGRPQYFVDILWKSYDPEVLYEFAELVCHFNGNSPYQVIVPPHLRAGFMQLAQGAGYTLSDNALSAALKVLLSEPLSPWDTAKMHVLLHDREAFPPYGEALQWLREEVRTNPVKKIEMNPFVGKTRERKPRTSHGITPPSALDASPPADGSEANTRGKLPIRSFLKDRPEAETLAVLASILPFVPDEHTSLVMDYFMGTGTFSTQVAIAEEVAEVLRQTQTCARAALDQLDEKTQAQLVSILQL